MRHGIRLTAGSHRALAAVHGSEIDLILTYVVVEQERFALAVLGFKEVQK